MIREYVELNVHTGIYSSPKRVIIFDIPCQTSISDQRQQRETHRQSEI